jgi:hypothetical protein
MYAANNSRSAWHSKPSGFNRGLGETYKVPPTPSTENRMYLQDCILSLIYSSCSECIQCWSSRRGLIVRLVRQGHVGEPLSAYGLSLWAILLAIINPWWAFLSSASTFSFSPIKSLRDGIFKLLRSPGINSKEQIPPACAGIYGSWEPSRNRVVVPARQAT